MRPWHWKGVIFCAALVTTQAWAGKEVGDYQGLPEGLAAAATAYDLAQYKADRAELERLLADDYTLAGSNGKSQTKAEFIADVVAPGSKTTYLAITSQVSKVWPDGAVLGGMADVKGWDRGKPFTARIRFADVWAKRDGRWQVIFTQANTAP
ncbi:nuclear transport factor 2 family protein [Dyella sp. EPa41]|uniref:nuclear transport factor 2 family protein n=1 Tax=Dyella sp. EPa41 TaxID=1561194 RepID=UPI0019161BD0|nr:nuclear transport factor 2 family protein [Dyella sp. EPa41]